MPCVILQIAIKSSSFHNGESYVLHDEAHYTFWMNLIERINEFHDIRLSNYRKHNSNVSSTASIHIHNLIKLWDRTYSDLPVLIVSNFSQVTPQLLNIAYKCFISHAHLFNYQQLSEKYWLDMIKITIELGQQRGSNLNRHHPFLRANMLL